MVLNKNSGFTLVELLVTMVIGLIIVLSASQVFLSSQDSYRRVEALSARQEALRFIADAIALDIRTADVIPREGGGSLELNYLGSRDEDVYCSGGDLNSVRYFSLDGVLKIIVDCEGEKPFRAEPLVGSYEDDAVLTVDSFSYELVGDKSLKLVFSFNALPGEDVEDRPFEVVVTNRKAVLSE